MQIFWEILLFLIALFSGLILISSFKVLFKKDENIKHKLKVVVINLVVFLVFADICYCLWNMGVKEISKSPEIRNLYALQKYTSSSKIVPGSSGYVIDKGWIFGDRVSGGFEEGGILVQQKDGTYKEKIFALEVTAIEHVGNKEPPSVTYIITGGKFAYAIDTHDTWYENIIFNPVGNNIAYMLCDKSTREDTFKETVIKVP